MPQEAQQYGINTPISRTNTRNAVKRAVEFYASRRLELHDGGIPLDGSEAQASRLQLLENLGIDPENVDLDKVSSWLGETPRSPSLSVNNAAENLLNIKAGIAQTKRNTAIQTELTTTRESFDKDRDGVPSGRYEYNAETKEFERKGPVEKLYRYHGTVVPDEDTIIKEFRPSPGNPDSQNRPSIGVSPAVYTTSDLDAAMNYAEGYNSSLREGARAGATLHR